MAPTASVLRIVSGTALSRCQVKPGDNPLYQAMRSSWPLAFRPVEGRGQLCFCACLAVRQEGAVHTVALMHPSATRRLGSAPGQTPANKGQRYRAEVLAEAEVNAIIGACSAVSLTGIRNRALIIILYRGGLRISEALALRPADIDPERGTVRVMDGKGHKPRTVGLEPGAMAAVQRWMDKRRQAGIRGRTLLCTLRGAPMSQQYARAMLRRAAEHAGVERRVVPHQLRHTHAAELVSEGVPMPVIRDQLGHSSLAVTDRYLRDIAPAEVIATMQRRQWMEPGR